MKNYVVWANCHITEQHASHGIQAAGDPGVRESYNDMFAASRASAQQNLRGAWQGVVFEDTQPTRLDLFRSNYQRIRAMWHSEPCNILFLDSDTLIVKPVEIFGRWPNFRLFNWTTPPVHDQFENYFNCAVRYFPAHMSSDVWARGDHMFENWDESIYDHEQLMYNKMFWSQNITWEDAHHPELNWQAESGRTIPELNQHSQFNTFPLGHARIIHYHGTRSHNRGAFLASVLSQAAGIQS